MNSLVAVLFVATISLGDVLGSYYHGPTAVPLVLHNGYLADTHEVAVAKSAHLATLSNQSHGHQGDSRYHGHNGDSRYHGPIAIPHVLHDGYLADTHEVAAAKSAHLATLSSQYHGHYDLTYHEHHGDSRYHGSIAVPQVLHDGHIADTHEVAAAKAEHFAALANARAHHHDYSGQYDAGYDHYSGASGAYHGYGARGGYPYYSGASGAYHMYGAQVGNPHYSGASGAYHGYGAHGGYHGPLAKPIVLPSGYLADTHEVAAIKHKHEIAHANQHHSHSNNSRHHYAH